MIIEEIKTILAFLFIGYCIGILHERWKYYKKTGKHLQDLNTKE